MWGAERTHKSAASVRALKCFFKPLDGENTIVQISESGWRPNDEGIKASYGNAGGLDAHDALYYLERHQSASGRSLLNSSKGRNQPRSAYLVTQRRNAQILVLKQGRAPAVRAAPEHI